MYESVPCFSALSFIRKQSLSLMFVFKRPNDFIFTRSVYVVYTVLGDVSIFVVGKDEYDELACKYVAFFRLKNNNNKYMGAKR